ncbi:MAG TPA: thiamine pyrophosphate-dependent enzyme, partial [Vicinamibacterales bacterium]
GWTQAASKAKTEWKAEAARATASTNAALPSDAQVIGAVQRTMGSGVTLLHAAGGLPGELHKLWEAGAPGSYHAEYGFSTMGYEIAGGLGVKLADPEREVYVMVGDGSYLMMAQEIVTSIQEGRKLIIVLLDSSGYASIGGLSRSVGSNGFGTQFDYKVPVDLAANAASLGAIVHRPTDRAGFDAALKSARDAERTTVIYAKVDAAKGVPGYESWWDVPVAEVSDQPGVQAARERWQAAVDQRRRV